MSMADARNHILFFVCWLSGRSWKQGRVVLGEDFQVAWLERGRKEQREERRKEQREGENRGRKGGRNRGRKEQREEGTGSRRIQDTPKLDTQHRNREWDLTRQCLDMISTPASATLQALDLNPHAYPPPLSKPMST